MTDYEKRVSRFGMFVLALGLLLFGLYGLYHESAGNIKPSITDTHSIITAIALMLLVPSQIASGVRVAGGAVVEVFKSWKASGGGGNEPPKP